MFKAMTAFLLALLLLPSAALAEPIGRWWTGFGQGTIEYGIKNDSAGSDTIYIACEPDRTAIRFSVRGADPKPGSTIIVTIGGDEWELYADRDQFVPTSSHVAADNFISLWHAMRRGQVARVRLDTGRSTVFTLRGAARVLPRQPCQTDYYDR